MNTDVPEFAQCATAGVVDSYAGLAVSPDGLQVYAGQLPRRHRRPSLVTGETMRGSGRAVFAASLLLFVGTLNIFYGIGALGDAHVYVGETRLVFNNLKLATFARDARTGDIAQLPEPRGVPGSEAWATSPRCASTPTGATSMSPATPARLPSRVDDSNRELRAQDVRPYTAASRSWVQSDGLGRGQQAAVRRPMSHTPATDEQQAQGQPPSWLL